MSAMANGQLVNRGQARREALRVFDGERASTSPTVHLDEWVAPDVADEHGILRAGKILEWMDVVGSLAATRHCRKPVVTASVDGMDLRVPIRVGEHVSMTAVPAYASPRSLGISVTLSHGPSGGESMSKSLDAYMTFVPFDEGGKPAQVPPLAPQSPGEVGLFRQGSIRREFRTRLAAGQLPAPASPATTLEGVAEQDRPLFVREFLKLLPRSLRMPWDREGAPRPQASRQSYVHKIEPVRSSKLNFHGTLYGGTLMRWVETAANLSARAYLGGAAVRLSGLHGLTFLKPVHQHCFVHIRAVVVHTGASTLSTLVSVQAEDALDGRHTDTLRGFLTFVPLESTRVAPLEIVSDEERALFEEVEHRLALERVLDGPGRD